MKEIVVYFKKFYDEVNGDDFLMDVSLPSYPSINVGDVITLKIGGNRNGFDVKPLDNRFIVRKIEHFFEKIFTPSGHSEFHELAYMFVYVENEWV